jgi:predicted ribosomally synthesized peptide with SipW-like signal peptide
MKMKRTTLGSAVAMVAAVGLIGGGTLAGWTATDTVEGNQITSGELDLNVSGDSIQIGPLYPGGAIERDYYLASATTNPDDIVAGLFVTMETEDTGNALWDEATFQLRRFQPTGGECDADLPGIGMPGNTHVYGDTNNRSLAQTAGLTGNGPMRDTHVVDLGGIGGAKDTCLRVQIQLPFDRATNGSMDQTAAFDLKFDLIQVDPATLP